MSLFRLYASTEYDGDMIRGNPEQVLTLENAAIPTDWTADTAPQTVLANDSLVIVMYDVDLEMVVTRNGHPRSSQVVTPLPSNGLTTYVFIAQEECNFFVRLAP